jgi:hypothetical protein
MNTVYRHCYLVSSQPVLNLTLALSCVVCPTGTAATDCAAATATVGEAEAAEEAIPLAATEDATTSEAGEVAASSAAGEEAWSPVTNAATTAGARTGPA